MELTFEYELPPHVITIDTVLASLAQRGFYDHHIDPDAATVQVLAVTEELGEVARMLRRHEQGVAELDPVALATEAADVVIAAICLLGQCAGEASNRFVSAKIKADEMRGWRHNGTPSEPDIYVTPLHVLKIIDPAMGTGALLSNPPYGSET